MPWSSLTVATGGCFSNRDIFILMFSDVRGLVDNLGWKLEYPEVQQRQLRFGDNESQAILRTQSSRELSQDEIPESQQNSMLKR